MMNTRRGFLASLLGLLGLSQVKANPVSGCLSDGVLGRWHVSNIYDLRETFQIPGFTIDGWYEKPLISGDGEKKTSLVVSCYGRGLGCKDSDEIRRELMKPKTVYSRGKIYELRCHTFEVNEDLFPQTLRIVWQGELS